MSKPATLLLVALSVGVLGDWLLRSDPWGIGAFLWIALSIGVAVALVWSNAGDRRAAFVTLLGVALMFAACVAWRDAVRLKGWNVLAVLAALTLSLMQIRGLSLRTARMLDYVSGVLTAAGGVFTGPILLAVSDVPAQVSPMPRSARTLRGVLVGLVITIPLVILFGALLVSADPVFEQLTRRLLVLDLERLVSHSLVIVFLAWLAAGYFRSATVHNDRMLELHPPDPHPTLGILEIGIPLGALTLLFLSFVVVQAQYLFGGEEMIRTTVDLTYAEYARRGFFELITVSGLVLPMLMAADWALSAQKQAAIRAFRIMSVVQLILVGLIMVSAAKRLLLYHDAYGLSESRLYAAAVLAWVAVSLAWFGVTVLRGLRERFVFGAVVAGFLVVATLNLMNPDAFIARVNVARATEGKELDVTYLESLSADATPTLVAALPNLALAERCAIAQHLDEERVERAGSSWRSWSLGRAGANRAVAGLNSVLHSCSL